MKLTVFTEYTLRTLLDLAAQQERLVTVADIALRHAMAKHHLDKVVHQLGLSGVVRTVRGRHGGIALALLPAEINLGQVVRHSEPHFHMTACFDAGRTDCPYARNCSLQSVLARASHAFLTVLDGLTLADLLSPAPSTGLAPQLLPQLAYRAGPPAGGV
jgi:Rrf2 family nitric oxide-sensitive transcriptional repressor